MESFSRIIPIDRNGFFCTSPQSLEASTEDSEFTRQYESFARSSNVRPNEKMYATKKCAIVTPEKAIVDTNDDKNQESKAEVTRWVRELFKAEPRLVTQKGLLKALEKKAPARVIRFMLRINPEIMNFPKVGPTPVQVAVQHGATLDVIQMLLKESPVGECIRNADFPESPLEYVKRCHSDRTDLIELLSRKNKSQDPSRDKKQSDKASPPSQFNLFPRYSNVSPEQPTQTKPPLLTPPPSFLTRRARANSIISASTASIPTTPMTQGEKTTTTSPSSEFDLFPRHSSISPEQPTQPKAPLLTPPHSFLTQCVGANSIISEATTPDPMTQKEKRTARPKKHVLSEVKATLNQTCPQPTRSMSRSQTTLTGKKGQAKPEKMRPTNKGNTEREELNNVKTLCALLWKSQRKMVKQVIASKNEIEKHSELLAALETGDEILEKLMKEQRSQMLRNWMALDTKEHAYQKRLEKMEKRYVEQLEKRLHSWTGSMRIWNESTREQLEELRTIVDSEAETNEYFRSNMTDWIEKYTADQENNTNVPSQVFATNLGEVNQKIPLCAGIRGAFCGYGTDTTVSDTDPIIGVDENDIENDSPSIRVTKRSWRPLFKNRDYSAVE